MLRWSSLRQSDGSCNESPPRNERERIARSATAGRIAQSCRISERGLVVSERNDEIVARLSVVEAQVARLRDDAAAESKLNLGFVQIKRTTDLIAFVAFILSALTLAAQLGEYTKSAELLSFFPSQIVIGNKEAMKRTRADDPVLFTATTQYVNRSLSGHNGIVQHEFFRIRIGDRNGQYHQVQYGPYQIVRTDVDDKTS
jgi:hypothetical protein